VTRTSATRLRPHLEAFRDEHEIPALGAAIVTREGLQDLDVIGERVRGGGDPARLDDRWHVGSCGKSITAALYARLVERGDTGWGVPLPELIPDLDGPVDPGWAGVVIDDVFVCEAGLPANLTKAEMLTTWEDTRDLQEQRSEVAARALTRPPHRPGRFRYSNLGYILIGAVIERITGMPFELALRTHVFEPLGIGSGGFGPPPDLWGHGGRMLALGPIGLIDLGRGDPEVPGKAESDNPAVMSPAGRMHLALEDWARFHRVFLAEGGDFLRPQTIERLLAPAPGRGHRMSMGWAVAPARSGGSFAQQGSNTYWVATAMMDRSRERTTMIVCNEGRARLLRKTPHLALRLLADTEGMHP